MEDYIQELSIKVQNIEISFKLKNLLKLQISSCPVNQTDAIYETVMTNQTISESLKTRFGSVDEIFTHFQFDVKQTECEFIETEKEAKLIFNDGENAIYEIFLIKDQDESENPENKEEKELEKGFAMLEQQLKRVNQNLTQKKNLLFIMTQQIAKIEQKLASTKKSLEEIRSKKYVETSFEKYPKYGEYIFNKQGKMIFGMSGKAVTDQMVQEIVQCDLSKIQLLYLGSNQITDHGFDLLFQNREWPVLQNICLNNNKIQNIHSFHKIPNLRKIWIFQNELSEASCTYMCENLWPKLEQLGISFKKGINNKCWEKLLKVIPEKFPKLKNLGYSLQDDISRQNQEKFQNYFKDRSIHGSWFL